MQKNEWVEKSTEERLQWYAEKIETLISSLDDEDFSESDKELLQEVKKRMIYDGTPSDARLEDSGEVEENYYQAVYKAYKALPNIETEHGDWIQKLTRSSELLEL